MEAVQQGGIHHSHVKSQVEQNTQKLLNGVTKSDR
jgi:hypothetical protein